MLEIFLPVNSQQEEIYNHFLNNIILLIPLVDREILCLCDIWRERS